MYIIQQWLILSSLILMIQSQSCLNSSGQQVDWWFILKMPRNQDEGQTGLEYFYCDSVNDCKDFLLQNDNLDSSNSPLMKTVKTIDFTDTNVISMLWSDQPKLHVTFSSHAHSKGIMSARLGGDQKAFIIAHSTPRFPNLNDENNIDDHVDVNFPKNGQHFLCISTTTNDINDYLAYQYYEAEVQIYKVSASPGRIFKNNYSNLFQLWSSKKPGKGEPHYTYTRSDDLHSKVSFLTRGSLTFEVFAKNEKFEKDFYSEVVAPNLEQDLIMETWVRKRHEKGLDKPECTKKFKTSSNEQVQFSGKKNNVDVTITYSYTKDHSKYGITLPKESKDSFISMDQSNISLKGQIFTNINNVRKKEDQYQNEDDVPNDNSKPMDIDNNSDGQFLRRKRKRENSEDDDDFIPKRRKLQKKDKYVCVSDLNRQESQWERGGLVYCIQNDNLWSHINKAFIGKQLCKD